jgi:hypothetical protein
MHKTKRILAFVIAVATCFAFAGCGHSKEIQEMETYIFSYGFGPNEIDQVQELQNTSDFSKWIEQLVPKIRDGQYTRLEISALLSNLNRAEIFDSDILAAAIVYYKADQYSERIKTENIIDVLVELEDNGYHGYSPYDYYNIYADSLTVEQVRSSAAEQLIKCNLGSGYYDNTSNRYERPAGDDGALLRWEYFYTYLGDFSIEEKRTYHYIFGHEISGSTGVPRERRVFYKGEEILLDAKYLENAQEVYLQPGTNAYIIYTKDEKIRTNIGITIPQFTDWVYWVYFN